MWQWNFMGGSKSRVCFTCGYASAYPAYPAAPPMPQLPESRLWLGTGCAYAWHIRRGLPKMSACALRYLRSNSTRPIVPVFGLFHSVTVTEGCRTCRMSAIGNQCHSVAVNLNIAGASRLVGGRPRAMIDLLGIVGTTDWKKLEIFRPLLTHHRRYTF